jgi:FkbM family methyltransferase
LKAALKRLTGSRVLLPLAARVVCARLVVESGAFLVRELVRRDGVFVYTLRGSGVRTALRHRQSDSATLAEVFHHRWYEPPAEVLALGEPEEILDLGANVGLFGAFALARWPRARLVAYEPDPANAAVHEQTIAANGELSDRWSLVAAAAAAADGHVRFAAGLDASSHVIEGRQGDARSDELVVPACDVLPAIGAASLVKIDIEGSEWSILEDPRFAAHPPRAIVLEYHPRGPTDRSPSQAAEALLAASGMRTSTIWHGDDGVGMLWAWRA